MEMLALEKVWLPLIVVMSTFLSPVILLFMTNRSKRAEKQEDYARQDAVAAQAAEAARLLAERQDANEARTAAVATRLLAANERVAASTKAANDKLDNVVVQGEVIHTLVNSNMTLALQAEFNAQKMVLAMLLEIVALREAASQQPGKETLAEIVLTKGRIKELETILTERLRQTQAAEKKIEIAEKQLGIAEKHLDVAVEESKK